MVSCGCGEVVGRRVAVGEHTGTVRYAGTIPSAKGTWLGIEWDDPSRGKHDGTYNGHRYFTTSHPTSGSFVHFEKADFGRSCVSAIKERYGSNQLTLTAEELKELKRAMNAPHLEMVGFDKINKKQSCFSELEVVGLRSHQVCCAGEDLASLELQAGDLDLSHNLLPSWHDLAQITVHTPLLHTLNISFNVLAIPDEPEALSGAFANLSHLIMGHMGYSWQQVLTCSAMWPQIQQLQVPFNNITSIDIPQGTLENLTHLDLEGNSISDWQEINKLGVLEKLECLNLCGLGLTSISLPPTQHLFKNLQNLLLSENRIAKWESVSQLNRLTKLQEVRFSLNPVTENLSVENIHSKLICRIGSLEIVNRKNITKEERRSAELDYLKEYGNQWLKSQSNEDLKSAFISCHPRFLELIEQHGAIIMEEEPAAPPVRSKLFKINLHTPDGTITKSLPRSMTVNSLLSLLMRLFSNLPTNPVLTFRSSMNPHIQGKMDNLYNSLDYYSLEDGDDIYVG